MQKRVLCGPRPDPYHPSYTGKKVKILSIFRRHIFALRASSMRFKIVSASFYAPLGDFLETCKNVSCAALGPTLIIRVTRGKKSRFCRFFDVIFLHCGHHQCVLRSFPHHFTHPWEIFSKLAKTCLVRPLARPLSSELHGEKSQDFVDFSTSYFCTAGIINAL